MSLFPRLHRWRFDRIATTDRRGLPASAFALPLPAIRSPALRTRTESRGFAGAYPMDTIGRARNARARAVQMVDKDYLTVAEAQVIFDRTERRWGLGHRDLGGRRQRLAANRTDDAAAKWKRIWELDYPGLRVAVSIDEYGSPQGRVREFDYRQWLGVPATGPLSLEVFLQDGPNVDLMWGQGTGTGYWEGAIPGPPEGRWKAVRFFGEAAMLVQQDTERRGLGAGNMVPGRGLIRDRRSKEVLAQTPPFGREVEVRAPVEAHAPRNYWWRRPKLILGS